MTWTLTSDVGAFRAAADGLLSSDPVRNTVLLSVLSSLGRLGPDAYGAAPPLLGWWSPDGTPRAAVVQTPPWPMLLTELPGDSAGQLAVALAGRSVVLPGVNGAEADVSAMARAWLEVTGTSGQVNMRQRLYLLGTLADPDPCPAGAARLATPADTALVAAWFTEFAAETGVADAADSRVLDDRLDRGMLALWEVGGEAASLAGRTDVLAGVARIGPVYTPPGLRGHGYGSAVTAAATRLAFGSGAESVILFTDLANPTSNSIYRRLGYEPVEDRVVLHFRV